MSTLFESAQLPRCPQCEEPYRPGSAFCGNCGASLPGTTNDDTTDNSGDAQATATFAPVPGYADQPNYDLSREPSPWASPDSTQYTPTNAVSSAYPETFPSPENDQHGRTDARSGLVGLPDQPRGIRGLFLGMIAMVLIGAVFALYLYDAWLSDSARSTVEGWLPWLD